MPSEFFGEVPAVTVAGRTHELRRSITRPDGIEITVAKIRDTAAAAGYLLDINCLVGMDILGAQPVTFDMRRRVLDFDGEPPFGCNAPLEIVAGIPVLRVQVLGLAIRCVLDTAAVPCFLPKRPRPAIDPVREEREFSPLLDEPFLSPIRVLPVTLFEREFHLEVGELPQILEDDLSTAEIDGVIRQQATGIRESDSRHSRRASSF